MNEQDMESAKQQLVDIYTEGLERGVLNRQLVEKLLSPYPEKWISWIQNGYNPEKKMYEFSPYVNGTNALIKIISIAGPGNWSFTITNETIRTVTAEDVSVSNGAIPIEKLGQPLYASVTGCFSIFGLDPICDTGEDVAKWGKISRNSDDKILKNTGNVVKNARTDALKRAARGFGIGLYLWLSSSVTAKNSYSIPKEELMKVQQTGEKLKKAILEALYGNS